MNYERNLIVHADDYGLTQSVSNGIIRAHREGIVKSTSVLANMASDEELEILAHTPSLDVGIHLTLTKGRSVLPKEEIPYLVDENGYFHKRHSKERPVKKNGFIDFTSAPEDEILIEFETQLLKLRNADIEPSHIDTHHHAHSDARIFLAVLHMAFEHRLAVRSISLEMREILRNKEIRTNDNFEGGFFGAKSITLRNLEKIINELSSGVTELMCHPGEISNELREISGYVEEREMELKVLIDPELAKVVKSSNVRLIGWHEIML